MSSSLSSLLQPAPAPPAPVVLTGDGSGSPALPPVSDTERESPPVVVPGVPSEAQAEAREILSDFAQAGLNARQMANTLRLQLRRQKAAGAISKATALAFILANTEAIRLAPVAGPVGTIDLDALLASRSAEMHRDPVIAKLRPLKAAKPAEFLSQDKALVDAKAAAFTAEQEAMWATAEALAGALIAGTVML